MELTGRVLFGNFIWEGFYSWRVGCDFNVVRQIYGSRCYSVGLEEETRSKSENEFVRIVVAHFGCLLSEEILRGEWCNSFLCVEKLKGKLFAPDTVTGRNV